MKRELDGFVMNRMQGALLEEAFRLVADGYARSRTSISAFARGWRCAGRSWGRSRRSISMRRAACATMSSAISGIYRRLFPQMQRRVDWAGEVLDDVESERRDAAAGKNELGERQRWRDRRLMALAAHKRAAAQEIGK